MSVVSLSPTTLLQFSVIIAILVVFINNTHKTANSIWLHITNGKLHYAGIPEFCIYDKSIIFVSEYARTML